LPGGVRIQRRVSDTSVSVPVLLLNSVSKPLAALEISLAVLKRATRTLISIVRAAGFAQQRLMSAAALLLLVVLR
jgi:hypothetical protein